MTELAGRVACVTGAGSGIGRAAAVKLAGAGADVALIGRTPESLAETADAIRAAGRRALVLTADVSDAAEMSAAFARIGQEFGQLDVLFANAGINGVWAPIEELTPEEWNATHAVNLRGTFLSLHFAVPLMRARGGAIIINASINGTRTFTTKGGSAYAASKAGQLALGQMAALELGQHRIRVNVICPGAIDTGIDVNRRRTEAIAFPDVPAGAIPLHGAENPEGDEVAELVLFLASDRSRHITGTPIYIDGGQSLLV